jgi:hypothetical protein
MFTFRPPAKNGNGHKNGNGNGNGHSNGNGNGNGHANGNGNGHSNVNGNGNGHTIGNSHSSVQSLTSALFGNGHKAVRNGATRSKACWGPGFTSKAL